MKALEFVAKILPGAVLLALPALSLAQYSELAGRDDLQAQQRALLKRIDMQDARITTLERELHTLRSSIAATAPAANTSSPAPHPRPKPKAGMHTYTVQAGDTLNSIARAHDTTPNDLMSVNNLQAPDNIQIGTLLVVPGPGTAAKSAASTQADKVEDKPAPPPAPATPTQTAADNSYTVAPGDTIARIATKHGVTIQDIIKENKLANPDRIAVGQKLVIPSRTAPATTPKETAADPKPRPKPAEETAASNAFPSGYAYYTVVRGDSLYSIARLFGTTEKEIVRLNKMKPGAVIHPDQQVLVPMANYTGPYSETASSN